MFSRVRQGRLHRVASALAFTTLLALVPLITVSFSILSLFPFVSSWRGSVEDFLYSNLVPATGEVVSGYLREFSSQAGTLTGLGLVALMATALLLLSTIEDALNGIWGGAQGSYTHATSAALLGDADSRSDIGGCKLVFEFLSGFIGLFGFDTGQATGQRHGFAGIAGPGGGPGLSLDVPGDSKLPGAIPLCPDRGDNRYGLVRNGKVCIYVVHCQFQHLSDYLWRALDDTGVFGLDFCVLAGHVTGGVCGCRDGGIGVGSRSCAADASSDGIKH